MTNEELEHKLAELYGRVFALRSTVFALITTHPDPGRFLVAIDQVMEHAEDIRVNAPLPESVLAAEMEEHETIRRIAHAVVSDYVRPG